MVPRSRSSGCWTAAAGAAGRADGGGGVAVAISVIARVGVRFGRSGQQVADSQTADFGAVNDDRHLLVRPVVGAVGVVRLVGRAGRGGVDLDLTVDQVDDPV